MQIALNEGDVFRATPGHALGAFVVESVTVEDGTPVATVKSNGLVRRLTMVGGRWLWDQGDGPLDATLMGASSDLGELGASHRDFIPVVVTKADDVVKHVPLTVDGLVPTFASESGCLDFVTSKDLDLAEILESCDGVATHIGVAGLDVRTVIDVDTLAKALADDEEEEEEEPPAPKIVVHG